MHSIDKLCTVDAVNNNSVGSNRVNSRITLYKNNNSMSYGKVLWKCEAFRWACILIAHE